ncbi:exodeoxyribonuclease VII large subunit [Prevotella sp. CAG:732]|nr:exodeoxyribonuclease VII large subunit [Prevotella sp. CAG:732]CDD21126.1 exodeoxyribonuclease VII large subunit [Prevotella sp. CAG:732]
MVNHLSLYELNSLVRDVISMSLPDSYWVEAELSEAREGYGGHCYMELIEKDERSNTPIAKAHASCWRNRWMLLKPQFERVTGQRIHAGMKVLLKVHAQFHENYGFSWIVDDIDPTYTMGDMARKRMEIIQTLKEEGVFDLQKELKLPMFCQRIAVISSATAAGYGDFCNQLADNGYGLQFTTALFAATMQGEGVEQSVISALNRINEEWENWDCVVIIRGGGATSDLSGFDTLALAENVANFPLPIITGIGHERDESVLDMISFQRVKTPTAAAAFLVDHLTEVYARIEDAQEAIVNYVKRRLQVERMKFERLSTRIPTLFSLVKVRQSNRLDQLLNRLKVKAERIPADGLHRLEMLEARLKEPVARKLERELHRVEMLSQRAVAQDPERLLSRGYSITLKDGKSIKDASQLKAGDEIETRFAKGVAKAVVK